MELTGAQRADIVKAQWSFWPQSQSRETGQTGIGTYWDTRIALQFGLQQDIMPDCPGVEWSG